MIHCDEVDKLIEHLDKNKLLAVDETETQPLNPPKDQNDIMSKFLRDLESSAPIVPVDDQLYYQQPNDQLIREAQEKVDLENKLRLFNINEQDENDENVVAVNDSEASPPPLFASKVNDDLDRQSVYSTASTFSKQEVKSRLTREKKKRDAQDRMKLNPKNIKGSDNAIRRRKKTDQSLANEDLVSYRTDGFW